MSSSAPPTRWVRRLSASPSLVAASRLFATIPGRALGHVVVVVVCLTVAYAGRASTRSTDSGSWDLQQSVFQPSAFGYEPGVGADTLVRPPMATTLAGTPQRLQVMHYEVQPGDTVGALADRFDISDNTIVWANGLTPDQSLTPGQQLVILPVSGVLYTTQTGDSVDSIAQRFQSDSGAITQFNQVGNDSTFSAGTQLVVPGGRIEDVQRADLSARSDTRPGQRDAQATAQLNPQPSLAPAKTTSDRAANNEGVSDRIPFKARTSTAPKILTPLTYHVTDGDTLSSIAQRFGVSPESIASASGLRGSEDSLSINQKLLIPPVPGALHVVEQGDTLEMIAQQYSADANAIAQANGIDNPLSLQIGQTLVIPNGKVPEVVSAPAEPQATYTVVDGDSISSIADSYNVDMRTIIDANGLSEPYLLQPGQQIVIPGASQAAVRSNPAPAPAQAAHTTYTVQEGDSLSQIADSFGVDLRSIASTNNLSDPSTLQPGQQLVIPGAARPVVHTNPAPAPAPVVRAPAPAPRPVVVAKPAPAPAPKPSGSSGWGIVSVASRYLGVPYVWGGTSPSGFDCSGLVWYVYRRSGLSVPRDMWGQYQSGSHVSRANLQPGDIVFFANTYEAGLSHDGIYIGGGRFINAVDYGIGVAVRSLSDPYWSNRYFGATRPW